MQLAALCSELRWLAALGVTAGSHDARWRGMRRRPTNQTMPAVAAVAAPALRATATGPGVVACALASSRACVMPAAEGCARALHGRGRRAVTDVTARHVPA